MPFLLYDRCRSLELNETSSILALWIWKKHLIGFEKSDKKNNAQMGVKEWLV